MPTAGSPTWSHPPTTSQAAEVGARCQQLPWMPSRNRSFLRRSPREFTEPLLARSQPVPEITVSIDGSDTDPDAVVGQGCPDCYYVIRCSVW